MQREAGGGGFAGLDSAGEEIEAEEFHFREVKGVMV